MKRCIALLAFTLTWGCSVEGPTGPFSCATDDDCLTTQRCNQGTCRPENLRPGCRDDDGDGFGVGETFDCQQCVDEGRCQEDCNDDDPAINPGLLDTCDGEDNNCNDEIDEVVACEHTADCPDETPFVFACEGGVCNYRPPNQLVAGCDVVVACVDGQRTAPDACF